jgi:hypothetical protein
VSCPPKKGNRRSFGSVPLARDFAQDDKRIFIYVAINKNLEEGDDDFEK